MNKNQKTRLEITRLVSEIRSGFKAIGQKSEQVADSPKNCEINSISSLLRDLGDLIEGPSTQRLVAKAGGVGLAMEAIQGNPPLHVNIRTCAAYLIACMTDWNEENQNSFDRAGVLPILVEILASAGRKSDNASRRGADQLTKSAADAIRTLCTRQPDRKNRVIRLGAIPALLHLMRDPDAPETQKCFAVECLYCLCRGHEPTSAIYKTIIKIPGLKSALLDVLQSGSDNLQGIGADLTEELMVGSGSADLMEDRKMHKILINLLSNSNLDVGSKAARVLSAIIKLGNQSDMTIPNSSMQSQLAISIPPLLAMLQPGSSFKSQAMAAGTLTNLTCTHEKNIRIAFHAGAIPLLLDLLQSAPYSLVHVNSMGALRNLLILPGTVDQFLEHGGAQILVSIIASSSAGVELTQLALAGIANMSQSNSQQARNLIVQAGAIPWLSILTNSGSEFSRVDIDTRELALASLLELARSSDGSTGSQIRIVQSGALLTLLPFLTMSHSLESGSNLMSDKDKTVSERRKHLATSLSCHLFQGLVQAQARMKERQTAGPLTELGDLFEDLLSSNDPARSVLAASHMTRYALSLPKQLCDDSDVPSRQCWGCGKEQNRLHYSIFKKPIKDLKLLQCSGCSVATYCSRECQSAHWKVCHKKQCASLRDSEL